MIPDQRLSSNNIEAELLPPRDEPYRPLQRFELGGVALNDPSQGLQVKVWTGELVAGQITLSAEGVAPTPILADAKITEFDFTFDQNMRPFICWVADGLAKFYWYNTLIEDFQTTTIPGARNPRCALDDKRDGFSSSSDIILAYLVQNTLVFRAQRDRYEATYTLRDGIDRLHNIGMGTGLRFLFQAYLLEDEDPNLQPPLPPAFAADIAWQNLGTTPASINPPDLTLFGDNGNNGRDGANAASIPVNFAIGPEISIRFLRQYESNWFDDDFSDSGFVMYALFNRLAEEVVLPIANWNYALPHRADNGSGIGVWFRRTFSLAPAAVIMHNGAYSFQSMTEVNPGNSGEDVSSEIDIRMEPLDDTTYRVDVYIDAVHRWTVDAVSADFPNMPKQFGCLVAHFHRYFGGTSRWTLVSGASVRVSS